MRYSLEAGVIAIGLGILWRSFFDFGISFVVFLFLLSVVSVIVLRAQSVLIAIFFIGVGMGILRTDMHIDAIEMTRPTYTDTIFEGIIIEEPDKRDKSQHVVVRAGDTKIRATLPLNHYLSYGDRVSLEGNLERPATFTTDEGREFAYDTWLLKDGITGVMVFSKIAVLAKGEGNILKHFLFRQKERFLDSLQQIIPEPNMSLLGGLLVGAKESMGEDLLNRFRDTGLIHIVVLSGYNVSIIADWLLRALGFLPTMIGTFVGSIAIVLFAILTGGSATIVRASIMALIVLLSRVVARKYDITRALLLAGLVMVLFHPLILAFDPSFQLSFLATLGLIYVAPLIERACKKVTASFGIREVLATTLATQLFVLPHLMWFSGSMSLIAPLSNILVLLVVPYTMALGFLTGVIGLLPSPISMLAVVVGAVTSALLSYQLFIVTILSDVPFASLHLPQFPYWFVVLIYGVLYLVYRYWIAKKRVATVSKLIA